MPYYKMLYYNTIIVKLLVFFFIYYASFSSQISQLEKIFKYFGVPD